MCPKKVYRHSFRITHDKGTMRMVVYKNDQAEEEEKKFLSFFERNSRNE